jgi:serine/threonine-protein kinase RIO1
MSNNNEAKWRRILYEHRLSPETNIIYPRLVHVLCNDQELDEDDVPNFSTYTDKIHAKIQRLHELGIFHGDLNNTNIVINNQEIYFIDFEYTCYIQDINIPFFSNFLELTENGFDSTIDGCLKREMDMFLL